MPAPPFEPPYAIRTDRLLLRCWEPDDVEALEEAIVESLDHLRPWMPWAGAEPIAREERLAILERFRRLFVSGEDYVYGVFDHAGVVVGGTGLHTRTGPGGLEIGYWIRARRTGAGLATEATAALTRIAFERCGVERVEIKVDPGNSASLAVPRRLGFTEEALLTEALEPFSGEERRRDAVLFVLRADAYPFGALPSTTLSAFDLDGTRIL
jgi:RimJ/RimL family protein N-acetyltransferase